MQKYCSTLKFVWQEFDAKPRYNFRNMLQDATLEVGEGFQAFYNVNRTSEYFLMVCTIKQSARHSDLASIGEASHENVGSWLVSSTSVKYENFQ